MLNEPVYLTDGVVVLRRPTLDDLPQLHEAVLESIPELQPWMSWAHPGYQEFEARTWLESLPEGWEQGGFYQFAITDARDGAFLGGSGLNNLLSAYRLANLGYWVRSSQRGKGIAGRAARLVARFGFEQINLVRAEIVVAEGNTASLRVAEKCGARREGLLRNRMTIGEQVLNAYMHSLIPADLGL
jgi:RimJ/RimL family protein N-acetyltransferase